MEVRPNDNLNVRHNVLASIFEKINHDAQFRQFVVRTYRIALDRSYVEFPERPMSDVFADLLPSDLKKMTLRHEEIMQIIVATLMVEEAAGDHKIVLHSEFVFPAPTEADYWVQKGKLLDTDSYRFNALQCFDKALDIDGGNVEALIQKGGILYNLYCVGWEARNRVWRDFERSRSQLLEAFSCMSKAVEIDPASAMAWHGKGACLAELGALEGDHEKILEAIHCFKRSLSLDPDNEQARNALRSICQQ